MTKYGIVLITVPNEKQAEMIAKTLVEKQMAACVNIIPGVRSIYSWQGELCDDSELLLVVKTKPGCFERLKQEVLTLHEYDVPEIIFLPVEQGHREYLQWIDQNISA